MTMIVFVLPSPACPALHLHNNRDDEPPLAHIFFSYLFLFPFFFPFSLQITFYLSACHLSLFVRPKKKPTQTKVEYRCLK